MRSLCILAKVLIDQAICQMLTFNRAVLKAKIEIKFRFFPLEAAPAPPISSPIFDKQIISQDFAINIWQKI